MKEQLNRLTAGKKVLILGFGREGQSTFRLLQEGHTFSALAVADVNPVTQPLPDWVEQICGPGYMDRLDEYDVVFKSPGVVLPRDPESYRCLITSQMEVFLQAYSRRTVGITGTKGKSTTSSLLCHVLSRSGVDCVLAGNIGLPVFDIVDSLREDTRIILEMSCHQLEYIRTSPGLAILLNLYEDHLDHYGTFERYARAKQNIYRFQKEGDLLLCGPEVLPAPGDCAARVCPVTAECLPAGAAQAITLPGEHNLSNAAFVWQVCRLLQVSETDFLAALATFAPLAHRLQHIGTVDGADYYDDSISTTCESTIRAICSIHNISTVLIGGMDRGIHYGVLIDYLLEGHVPNVVLMYESGRRILQELEEADPNFRSAANFVYVPDLRSAVEYAHGVTPPGGACVLSPAAASYTHFKNFEDRGDKFRQFLFELHP